VDIFRVPKREVTARLVLDDGSTVEGRLFTAYVGAEGRLESVEERLNDGSEEFVALACDEDRFLLNKAGIILCEVREGQGELDHLPGMGGRKVPVRVTLVGGMALVGTLRVLMPAERSRVLDYLNAAPRFITIEGPGKATLVQRRFIVTVRSDVA
jgi:hypothetical protein